MDVTVVVTPRERFSQLPNTLESLFATIPNSIAVIVNDGGAPEGIRSQIRAIQSKRDFTHVEPSEFVLPPMARNAALKSVSTEYIVYADNDLRFDEGWLDELVRTAEETNAGAVCPISLVGPLPKRTIHHAGSRIEAYLDENGLNRLLSEHRLEHKTLDEAVAANLFGIPMENDEFEYHCALIRTSVMREIGGHDERQTHYDHLNDSLRIKARGHKIYLAPKAIIEYVGATKFEEYDWPYFMWRWTDQNSTMSAEQIHEAFGVWKNVPGAELNFTRMHRARAVRTVIPKWVKNLRPARLRNYLIQRAIKRRQALAPAPIPVSELYVAPGPGELGLVSAGITGAKKLRMDSQATAAE